MKLSIYKLIIMAAMLMSINFAGCSSDDSSATDSDTTAGSDTATDSDTTAGSDTATDSDTTAGSDTATGSDTTVDSDTTADSDSSINVDPTENQSIGSACSCTTDGCNNSFYKDVPMPAGGEPAGCADVPANVSGAELVCLRSYAGDNATKVYFANGMCAVQSTKCTADNAVICKTAQYGDYEAMKTCPANTVMLMNTVEISTIIGPATIDSKSCVKACKKDEDCRNSETDPVWNNKATQYQCIDKDGVKFCYDPRNLTDGYTAQSF